MMVAQFVWAVFEGLLPLILVGAAVAAITKSKQRRRIAAEQPPEWAAFSQRRPGVYAVVGWQSEFALSEAVEGIRTVRVPQFMPLQDIREFIGRLQYALNDGYTVRIERGQSPVILEIGMACKHMGYSVMWFNSANFERQGLSVWSDDVPRRPAA